MRLGARGRYAVTALFDLALSGEQPISLGQLAERRNLSQPYLEQLFGRLRRAGVVESARGPGGGYVLARAADLISLADILAAVEEEVQTTACETGAEMSCAGQPGRCVTHDLWRALEDHIAGFFRAVTLADVVAGRFPLAQAQSVTEAAE